MEMDNIQCDSTSMCDIDTSVDEIPSLVSSELSLEQESAEDDINVTNEQGNN